MKSAIKRCSINSLCCSLCRWLATHDDSSSESSLHLHRFRWPSNVRSCYRWTLCIIMLPFIIYWINFEHKRNETIVTVSLGLQNWDIHIIFDRKSQCFPSVHFCSTLYSDCSLISALFNAFTFKCHGFRPLVLISVSKYGIDYVLYTVSGLSTLQSVYSESTGSGYSQLS